MALLVVGGVQQDEPLEVAVGVEHLDAPVIPIGDVDIVLSIDGDIVRRVERSGVLGCMSAAGAAHAPALHPVAVLVEFRHARVAIAVADEDVVARIPRHVGGTAEVAVDMRRRRSATRQRLEVIGLVGSFLAASQVQRHVAGWIELRHGLRALVDDPEVVVPVEPNTVAVAEAVNVLADLTDVFAGCVELEQLC